jgi:hypothetical protein
MQFADLDMIVRRTLLERGVPIHWYSEFLFHGASALRELSKDTLKIINTVKLPLNSYFAVEIPDDAVDILGVSVPAGQLLQAVPKVDNMNPLRVNDAGAFVPYTNTDSEEEGQTFIGGLSWFWNASDYGEPTGRFFGAGGGTRLNGYQVFKERRQIQFTETFTSAEAIVMYIGNGQSIDNASKVDWLAFMAIQSFIDWKRSPNSALKDSAEANTYYNEKRLLRANLNDLTTTDVIQILRKNFNATIKN